MKGLFYFHVFCDYTNQPFPVSRLHSQLSFQIYKMWAARDLPPGSVTALQIVRNLHSEGHGLRWLIAEVAGEPPWSPALEEVSLQVSEVTPPSSVALIPGA